MRVYSGYRTLASKQLKQAVARTHARRRAARTRDRRASAIAVHSRAEAGHVGHLCCLWLLARGCAKAAHVAGACRCGLFARRSCLLLQQPIDNRLQRCNHVVSWGSSSTNDYHACTAVCFHSHYRDCAPDSCTCMRETARRSDSTSAFCWWRPKLSGLPNSSSAVVGWKMQLSIFF